MPTVVAVARAESASLPARLAAAIPPAPDQTEQPDDRVGVAVRAGGEQEGERGPQHAEGGEGAGAVPRPPAQHGLGGQQPERPAHQLGVAAVRAATLGRQRPPQDEREDDHEGGREPVDGPPSRGLGHQPRHRAGEQDAHQQPRHDAGHDATSALLGRQVGREGDHDLSGHRGAADGDRGQAEEPDVRRQRAADQRDGRDEEEPRHQARRGWRSPSGTISEARRIADLRGGDDRRRRAGPAVEGAAPPGATRAPRSRGWPPPRRWRPRSARRALSRCRRCAVVSACHRVRLPAARPGVRRCPRAGSRR